MSFRSTQWLEEAKTISKVLEQSPFIDKSKRIKTEEFKQRRQNVMDALAANGIDCAFVYSNEQYCGDVPYLGGNTNISVEPVAGVIGKGGFHLLAGLEGGYVAEQLTPRADIKVHKVEMLKLADEDYPVQAEKLDDVIEEAAGGRPKVIGLLTPRAVFPVDMYEYLQSYLGKSGSIIDAQLLYYKIKYEKSEAEMDLIRDASLICDEMLKGMLAVLKPGMYETEVSAWGYAIGQELGAEEFGVDVMVTANEANRTLIGKALNRKINEGDMVHLGVAPKRDGLTACERVSVVATLDPKRITSEQKYWIEFVEQAFRVGLNGYIKIAKENLPAKIQEQAIVDYFKSREDEVSNMLGKKIDLVRQKPYSGTHNAGYTECQEFYGAITLNSEEPLGKRIVTMLDVAVRGVGNMWDDIVIPGLDFVLVEKTLGKFDKNVEVLTKLPINVQHLVGMKY